MKPIYEQLVKMYEDNIDFMNVLSNSVQFDDDFEYLKELQEEGSLQFKQYDVKGEKVTYCEGLYLCTKEQFDNIIMMCCIEYRQDKINTWLEDYFDDNAFDNDVKTQCYPYLTKSDGLALEVLAEALISEAEAIDVDNNTYVIFK